MISVQEQHNDTMQGDYEASTKGIQSKDHSCTLHYSATYVEGHANPGGNTSDPDHSSSSEPLQSPEKCIERPLYHHFGSWFANPLQGQPNAFQGKFHPFAVNYRLQYPPPLNMFPQIYPYDRRFQDFQYFVVIDFEATCDKDKNPHPQEIIEFPSVIVNSFTGQLEASFQTYVRPTCNQQLSDFCKDLTGIQQIQVDRGVTLSEALIRHDKWLENKGIKNSNFAVVTWSNWDCRVMLESECRFKNIRKPQYFSRWINLRVPFYEVFGGVRCNLKEAVEKAGLSWQGRPHCGLDDAKNTARLLAVLMHKGFKLSITNSLAYNQSTTAADDNTFAPKPTQEKPASVLPQPQKVWTPLVHYHPYCYCRIRSSKGMIRKPGPKQGSIFFGCGNWTSARGARCQYFEWASP